MSKINAGQLFAKAMKKEGIDAVFTLSGGHIMPILYACREEGIRVIDVRHECSGAYAAIAYAKTTGKPGVVITTAGPGVTNVQTAMAEAAETSVPVIHIGGASPLSQNEMGPMQNIDSMKAMEAFCKWSRKIYQANRVPEYMAMAFRQAPSSTPGPVYLEIAADTLGAGIFEEETIQWPVNYRVAGSACADAATAEKIADILINAKKPVMVLGAVAPYCAEEPEKVRALAEYLQIPVFAQMEARGMFGNELTDRLFTCGEGAVAEADVILELGVDRNYKIGMGKPPRMNGEAIRIVVHPDAAKIGWNWKADIGVAGGISAVCGQVLALVKDKTNSVMNSAWVEEAAAITARFRTSYTEAITSGMAPVHPGRVAAEVAKFVDEYAPDWHIICDGGDSSCWMDALAHASYRGQVLRYGPLGTIGTGQGQAIGAWAGDGKPVVYFTGDGSFGFYIGEFDTYLRHGIPVICVISNDSSWGMIKLSEGVKREAYIAEHGHLATTLAPMRAYEKIADMWGGVGLCVSKAEDIIPAMKKIMDSGLPGILNVETDQTVMSPATRSFAGVPAKK